MREDLLTSDGTARRYGRRAVLTSAIGLAGTLAAVVACGQSSASPTTAPAQVPSAAASTKPPTAASGAATPSGQSKPVAGGQQILLNGAGSTFDYPLFSKAFSEYSKLHPNVKVNYQSVGSGAGIQQFSKGTVDFGATDAPMTDQQIKEAGGDVIHLPITLGAVSVAYNLSGVKEGLKLDGPALADIFLGKITAWNDPAIAKLNSGVTLPNSPIAVVHRSDGSGTTDIFTTYLSQVSADWKSKVGSGTAVKWPVGIGGKGSEGVAGQVTQTPGGIGYFELAYAKQNNLTSAAMSNGAGAFLLPSSAGASDCAAGAAQNMPADLRVRIAGCTGQNVYPISGFSWVILHQNQTDQAKGEAVAGLFSWLVTQGQSYAKDLFYAPLPRPVVKLDQEKLRSVNYQGKPLGSA